MKNSEFIALVKELINDPEIKSIKVIKWQECGEFDGEDPRPIFKVVKRKYDYDDIQD